MLLRAHRFAPLSINPASAGGCGLGVSTTKDTANRASGNPELPSHLQRAPAGLCSTMQVAANAVPRVGRKAATARCSVFCVRRFTLFTGMDPAEKRLSEN